MFVSVVSEARDYNYLSGKYNFHSIKNKTVVYVRDECITRGYNTNPVLRYQKPFWYVADIIGSSNEKFHYWLKLETQGLLYNITYI